MPFVLIELIFFFSYDVEYNGGVENVNSIEGVSADLDSYNPTPVYDSSSFWIMLCGPTYIPLYYAQIGWEKNNTQTQEYIFIEYWDRSVPNHGVEWDYYYDPTTQSWVNTPDYVPIGSINYSISYSSGTGMFYLSFIDGSGLHTLQTSDLGWTPDYLEVLGETHNYGTGSPINLGDHVPGDTVTKVQAQSIQYELNGQFYSSSLTEKIQGNGDEDGEVDNIPGFRIWDTRCSN